MVGEIDDREFAEQCDAELAGRITRSSSREPVDRREPHLHLKLLAECGCLIDKVASLGPMDVYFLQRDQVRCGRAYRRCCSAEVAVSGPDVVGHHAQRNFRSRRGQMAGGARD